MPCHLIWTSHDLYQIYIGISIDVEIKITMKYVHLYFILIS